MWAIARILPSRILEPVSHLDGSPYHSELSTTTYLVSQKALACRLSNIIPLLAAGLLWGQAGNIISNELEFLPDQSDEAVAALNDLLDNPLPLNNVTPGELWFLPDSLVELLISQRTQRLYTSWMDLQQRTGMTPVTVEFLKGLLILPANNVQGALSSRVAGNNVGERIRSKLVLKSKYWYSQGVLQRDPEAHSLANLAAATFSYSRNLTAITLGSHRIHWGSGLVLGGDTWGRSGQALLSGSNKYYIRPAYSIQPANILNGAAVSRNWAGLTLDSGLSDQKVNFITERTGNIGPARSPFNPAGDVGRERIGYALAIVTTGNSNLGYLVSQRKLTMSGDAQIRQVYQSATAQYQVRLPLAEVRLSSEVALGNGVLAGIMSLGLIVRPERGGRLKLLAQWRQYPESWHSLKGLMPGFGSANGNGQGWYLGWNWLKAGMELAGYIDSYKALGTDHVSGWNASGVSSGLEISLPLAVGILKLRYSQIDTHKGVAIDEADGLVSYQQQYKVVHQLRSKLLIHVARTTHIDLFAVYKWTDEAKSHSRGRVWGSSVQRPQSGGNRLGLGLVAYSTDDWDSRIVSYQFGLPGEMNMRNLYGQGIEIYGRYWIKLAYGQLGLRLSKRLFNSDQSQSNSLWNKGGLQLDIKL